MIVEGVTGSRNHDYTINVLPKTENFAKRKSNEGGEGI